MKQSLVRAIVRKLQIDSEIVSLEERNGFLQGIAVFAADADQISLNRGLRFLFRVLHQLYDLEGFLDDDPLLHGDFALGRSSGGGFDRAVGQAF